MDLKIADESDRELWDSLVEDSSHATLYHKWDFLRIIEKYSGTKLYPLIGFNGDKPAGIYPLFYKKKNSLRMIFSPPPHLAVFYLGPLMADRRLLKKGRNASLLLKFHKKVEEFIRKDIRADYVSIHTVPGLDCRPYKWAGYDLKPIYSYCLNLENGLDNVWDNFDSDTRRDINRAREKGVTIEEGSRKDINTIYDLMNERYEEQGKIISVPREYLYDVYDTFKPHLKILLAKYDGEIKSGVMDIHYKDRHMGWIGNSRTGLKGICPNALMIWKSLEITRDDGFKRFDILGAAGIKRLSEYYDGYNPELVINFLATKYNTPKAWIMEKLYFGAVKPVRTRLKLLAKGRD